MTFVLTLFESENLLPCDLSSFSHSYSLLRREMENFLHPRSWCKDAYRVKD